MDERTHASGLLAIVSVVSCAAAFGQAPCQRGIDALERGVEERERSEQRAGGTSLGQIARMLDAARDASEEDCRQILTEARDLLGRPVPEAAPAPRNGPRAMSPREAAALVGNTVLASDEQRIGEVSGIIRARDSGELAVLIDVGGFFGLGAHRVAIPVNDAEFDEDGTVRVPLTRDELEDREEYARDRDYEIVRTP